MKNKSDAFKHICATCRHLSVLSHGREFDKIIDTEYTTFSCNILGWKTKEFYLMVPTDKDIGYQKEFKCEFWEQWNPDIKENENSIKRDRTNL